MRLWLLLLTLFLASPVWAASPWTHSGTTWKHKNGLCITFPTDFLVEEGENGFLNVQGKGGFVNFLVVGAKGEKEFKGWLSAQHKTFEAEGLKFKQEPSRKMDSGVLAHIMDTERTSEQGIVFVVVATAFQQGQDYLCLQMFYPKEREKSWTPLFQDVFNSVRPAK